MSSFLQNLNSSVLCAIDVETTGLDPKRHDLVQVAAIVLDGMAKPTRHPMPFAIDIKPRRPENDCDPEAMRINRIRYCEIVTRGMDYYDAGERFVEWFESIRLAPNKRLVPVACNWPHDRAFLLEWLGPETFDMLFHAHYRDVMAMAVCMNDRAGWRGEKFPYAHCNLSYLCTTLGIERTRAHEALDDAFVTSQVYMRLIQGMV